MTALTEIRGGTTPTAAHLAAMRAFPGWGPLAPLFDNSTDTKGMQQMAALSAAADGLDLHAVSTTLDTSFYTPAHLIESMWALLGAAGFTGGRVLDLGCGTARFLDHKPAGLPVLYTGVEIEPVTAEIARTLHPEADILTQDVSEPVPSAGFDATIGNVPFAATTVRDGALQVPLHAYCALKAARLTRPGGYVVIVCSRYLLDSNDGQARAALAKYTNLVGAVRLPSRYFASEGTDVVADLLIMQVRPSLDGAEQGSGWPVGVDRLGASQVPVSTYWSSHPQHVAGTMTETGFSRSPLAVHADDPRAAAEAAITAAAAHLTPMTAASAAEQFADVPLTDGQGRAEGSFHAVDDMVVRISNGRAAPVSRPGNELRALIGLRDAVDELLAADADYSRDDTDVAPLRERTRALYTDYLAAFGPLNRGKLVDGPIDPDTGAPAVRWQTPTMGGFRHDPGYTRVLAVEVFDRNNDTARPADILQRRVNRRPEPVTRADSPAEALAVSLGEGSLDLARIAGLLDLPDESEAAAALGDRIYHDPSLNSWVRACDYLSGQVRRKLATARLAAITDARYLTNVAALEKVQPPWLTATDIRIELGSPLITAADVEQFAVEVLGAHHACVVYTALAGHWEVDLSGVRTQGLIEFGTSRAHPEKLLQYGLNARVPVIKDTVDDPATGKKRQVRNINETEAAVAKLGEVADRFAEWVWQCPDRARRIEHDYNHRFNALVPRTPDGSHLQFPRLADGVNLWKHQKDWVDYALTAKSAVCGFEVGLGKTLASVTLAVTLRDLGLANRPMIAIPDHLIEQISAEAHRSHPTCKFLVVTRDDLTRERRRLFAARCATGDWDAVIITHTGFSSIPMPADYERAQLRAEIDMIGEHMRESGVRSKRLAGMLRTAEQRLRRLRTNSDPLTVTFDQLGVDHVSVDEADRFRRLPITTTSDGFSMGSSMRAYDLYLKIQWLRERAEGRPYAAALTGTPFVNSLAESYVLQKMYAPQHLSAAGVESFDTWAAQFVRFQTVIEVAPDGSGFRSQRRPAVIQNLPELRSMLREFMMLVRADDVGIVRPEARFHTVTAEPSPAAAEYKRELVARSEALRSRRITDLRVDNMLKICGDGRSVALDTHLVGVPEVPGHVTKLVLAADKIAEHYKAGLTRTFPGSEVPGVFQFVMCDFGTPHRDDTRTYGRLRRLLIDRGVPAHMIRFIHEAKGPKAREALFAACRAGQVAALVGSSTLSGLGVNAQLRAVALHHLDLSWTAAAFEQRNGRIIRHGNAHDSVDIYSYCTAGTFDAFMAGVVERKARGFAHLYRMDSLAREIDDISDTVMTVAELKAAATGNDLLLRQHELRMQVRALRNLRSTSMQGVVAARQRAQQDRRRAEELIATATTLRGVQGLTSKVDVDAATRILTQQQDWSAVTIANLQVSTYTYTRMQVQIVNRLGALRLDLTYRQQSVSSREVPYAVRRHGARRIAEWAQRSVAAWSRGLEEQVAQLLADAQQLRAAADDAESAAATVTFDRQHELDQLMADLDQINTEIAAVADADEVANDNVDTAA
ncbi:methyltransferase type 11 [Gordonia phosphorivorans]|uniref:Methyltransferase type 11 n=1 Tax=Gordonia phosphorivorans TaxID=1056982 RepID=A0ABV6H5U7_9ACTN